MKACWGFDIIFKPYNTEVLYGLFFKYFRNTFLDGRTWFYSVLFWQSELVFKILIFYFLILFIFFLY